MRPLLATLLTIALAAAPLALATAPLAAAMRAQTKNACAGSAPYDCAAAHVARQEIATAIAVLEPLVKAEPRNLKALNLLGIALTAAGRLDAADARFREALRVDAAFVPSLKNLALNAFTRDRLTEAERGFRAVLKLVPEDEVAHLHLGEIAYLRQDCRTALPHYEKGGTRIRLNNAWVVHHASCLLKEKATARAFEMLTAIPATDAAARFDAGVALGAAGVFAEAATFFATARKGLQGERAYEAAYNQTLMLVNAGDHAGAAVAAEEVFAAGAGRGELYNLASRAYFKLGRIKDAYDALRTATRLEPEVEEHYVDLAMMCLDLENPDLGMEIVDVGLHHRPASFMLYLQRGVLLAMKAQLGEAEKAFETARSLAPDKPAPYAALAMIWMQTGQTEKAVERLRTEARARPNDHVIPYTFAVALVRSGIDPAAPEANEAVEALQASIRANPEFAPARSQLGRLLLRRNDVDGAVRELEKAVALDASATAALYNLGQAYNRKGDRERATKLLARVSKLNAQERGDDPDGELKRTVVRIVREGSAVSTAP
jgi:tetratricopeptide (TPR) repeat protein